MSTFTTECDDLVVGTGATAMAFVDSLLTESPAADVVMVDRHHRPGGHWNDAYPFVRLHQPAAWYGVASLELDQGLKDTVGANAGYYSLASGARVLAHFDQAMQQRFLPTGRVRWLPMSEYGVGPEAQHQVRSLTTGDVQTLTVRRKLVNATHAQTAVPSTHPPKFGLAEGVDCIAVNGLPQNRRPYRFYTVVGSGKTGMDAIAWLLDNGVGPERIRWIMPRDPWLLNRANFQPGLENYERSVGSNLRQFDAIVEATSLHDLFARLEASQQLMRIDPAVQPSTFRCAVVAPAELDELRRIKHIVRLGHVRSVEPDQVVLDQGTLPADPDTLYVDCSAGAIVMPPDLPVFDGDRINLLMVRTCQPLFSAALIAYVESHVDDPAEQNALCAVVPSPERPLDWLRMWRQSLANGARWRQRPALSAWISGCRLNAFSVYLRNVRPDDTERLALAMAIGARSGAVAAKLSVLLAEAA